MKVIFIITLDWLVSARLNAHGIVLALNDNQVPAAQSEQLSASLAKQVQQAATRSLVTLDFRQQGEQQVCSQVPEFRLEKCFVSKKELIDPNPD